MLGMDGMRHLGADPSKPADDVERLLHVHLAKRILHEERRASRREG